MPSANAEQALDQHDTMAEPSRPRSNEPETQGESMEVPADRRYSESHEWHLLEGDVLTLGLTQFAVDQLTDITYVEMKEAGTSVDAGDVVGEVESVKTTSDIYTVLGGEIMEINSELDDNPATLNTDPYGDGWLVKIKVTDTSALDALMDARAYTEAHVS